MRFLIAFVHRSYNSEGTTELYTVMYSKNANQPNNPVKVYKYICCLSDN